MRKIIRYILVSSFLFFIMASAFAQSKDKYKEKNEKPKLLVGNEKSEKRKHKADKEKIKKHKQKTAKEKNKAHEKKLRANKGHMKADKNKRKEIANDEN